MLVHGAELPTSCRLQPFTSTRQFIVSVLDGNVALLRLKKGPVKKVCSAQMTDQAEAKQFVNLTAQAGGYWARNVTLSECG